MTFIHAPEGANLLDSRAQCLVNPVNCVGVPGAGLAKAFCDRWPGPVGEYVAFCESGKMRPGMVHDALMGDGRRILSIATKRHWREPSRLADVNLGLLALAAYCRETPVSSVALPALGCGLGGLYRRDVAKLVTDHLSTVPVVFHLYGLKIQEG